MLLRRLGLGFLATAVALPLLGGPAYSQEECEGQKPKGGKWTTSAELYISRARQPRDPEDREKRYQEALIVLQEGYEKQSENPRLWFMAGTAHEGLRQYPEADAAWTKAEEMWSCYHQEVDSLRYNAWVNAFNLGVRYANQQDVEQAKEWYGNAITIYGQLPQAYLQLANFYAETAQDPSADPEEASAARNEAIQLYRQAQGTLDSPRLSDENREQLSRAAYFNVAQFLAFDERYEEAVGAYEDFLTRDPSNVTAKSNAAVTLTLAADNLEEQAYEMESGAEKSELEAKAEEYRARARTHYEELLTREDLDANAYHEIGAGLARSRENAGAATAFGKALDLEPYRVNTLEQLAFVLYADANYDSLVVVADKLVERYPLNLNNMALLANAYRELDNSEKALEILEERETLKLEILRLELEQKEGITEVTGVISNIGLEGGTPIELQFDVRDDLGEIIGTETASYEAPEQGTASRFRLEIPTEVPAAGLTYRFLGSGAASSGL